jgi:hypothetical protein
MRENGHRPKARSTCGVTIKLLLLAILAACGVNSNSANAGPPVEPPNKEAPDETEEDKDYFCCHSVNTGKRSGDGCVTIGKNQIDSCSKVLACAGGFTKDDGTVTCTL